MANIRPNQLPPATEITNNDRLILDQGAAGVNAAPPKSVLDAFAPIATQSEAEAGQDNEKRMTPLRAQQHLLAQGVPNTRTIVAGDGLTGGGTLDDNRTLALSSDSITSLALADNAVQPSREINAGEGLAGGGNLSANRSIALSAASLESLEKADTALQAPGGQAGQILAKSSNIDNDVAWVSSEAATAVSYGPQDLSEIQKGQARANIDAGILAGFRNKIINGDFRINQRGGVKKPPNGVYGFDRWKGHANGIEQIIEGLPAGTYTLTFGGGGTGSVGGQAPAASPAVFTIPIGGNISVVVPSTATRVSLTPGDSTTEDDPFSPRNPQQELALCRWFFDKSYDLGVTPGSSAFGGCITFCPSASTPTIAASVSGIRVNMRSVPTVTVYSRLTGAAGRMFNRTKNTDIIAEAAHVGQSGFTIRPPNTGGYDPGDVIELQWSADAEL